MVIDYEHEGYAGRGLTSTRSILTLLQSWEKVSYTLKEVELTFRSQDDADRWTRLLDRRLGSLATVGRRSNATICIFLSALYGNSKPARALPTEVLDVIRQEVGKESILDAVRRTLDLTTTSHFKPDLVDQVIRAVMPGRLSCVHNIMILRNLIPSLQPDVRQDVRLNHNLDDGFHLKVEDVDDDFYHTVALEPVQARRSRGLYWVVSLGMEKGMDPLNMYHLPMVRWDKLDPVLQTCHQPPTVVVNQTTHG